MGSKESTDGESNNRVDWGGYYLKICNENPRPAAVPDFKTGINTSELDSYADLFVDSGETFAPNEIDDLSKDEIKRIGFLCEKVFERTMEQGQAIANYGCYVRILQKILVLWVERHADCFNSLSKDNSLKLMHWKMEFPTEREIYFKAYAIILQNKSTDLSTAKTFINLLTELMEAFPTENSIDEKPVDSRLIEKLEAIDNAYKFYFIQNKDRFIVV